MKKLLKQHQKHLKRFKNQTFFFYSFDINGVDEDELKLVLLIMLTLIWVVKREEVFPSSSAQWFHYHLYGLGAKWLIISCDWSFIVTAGLSLFSNIHSNLLYWSQIRSLKFTCQDFEIMFQKLFWEKFRKSLNDQTLKYHWKVENIDWTTVFSVKPSLDPQTRRSFCFFLLPRGLSGFLQQQRKVHPGSQWMALHLPARLERSRLSRSHGNALHRRQGQRRRCVGTHEPS